MTVSGEEIRITTERCEQFRGSKAPAGYPDSLALCIVDSVQSTGVTYASVVKIVNKYRAYRSEQLGNADNDSASDLVATFTELGGHEAWAKRIGNGNRTSTTKGAPLKAHAIQAEAKAMLDVGVVTAEDLRTAAESPGELAQAKAAWLDVTGQRSGITWHYVQMLAGLPGIKPDRMIIRFVAKTLDRPIKTVTSSFCVELLSAAADELAMSATELDHAIWNFQRTR